MNYLKIYDQIIERAKCRTLLGYKERHHIIPKCLGGSDDASNLVELTAREHYIVHKLLMEIYPNVNGLVYAVWMMSNFKNKHQSNYKVSSREYERYRLSYIKIHAHSMIGHKHSNDTIQKMKQAKIGHVVSDETRKRISNALTGRPGTWIGRKHNDESKKKMSDSAKGRKHNDETKKKMSEMRKGNRHTNDSRKKMSDAAKGKPKEKFICSFCGKQIGGKSNIIRHEYTHQNN